MRGRIALYLIGAGVLLALVGCGRGFVQYGERGAWRHQAEAQCLQSGAVKESAAVVRMSPIEGPGICGADFPLKVAALGPSTALGYGDEYRPPASIPNAGQPRMRWITGPPPATVAPEPDEDDEDDAPSHGDNRAVNAPMSLDAPGAAQGRAQQAYEPQQRQAYPQQAYPQAPRGQQPQYQQNTLPQRADDIPDDAILPERGRAPSPRQAYAPPNAAPQTMQPLPRLGPIRTVANVQAAVSPPATLSCPIVSALDRWVADGVQPAAMRWFGQPVVEIKQISSYSCRGMVGAGTNHISEHAFGNALDVAGFILADGRKVMVKDGWNGAPEEAGFLHDVQGAACDVFTTVLAPGYNAAHYNHIHVDLMRRSSGRRPCRPNAIPGEVAAAKATSKYARRGDPSVTGSLGGKGVPRAVPGEDGYFESDDTALAGSVAEKRR
jgi:hypothetical protein